MIIYLLVVVFIYMKSDNPKFSDKVNSRWRKLKLSPSCADLKLNQVWICETCGLEIKIVKECDCSQEESKPCEPNACLACGDKSLKLKG